MDSNKNLFCDLRVDGEEIDQHQPWLLVSQGKNLETHIFYSTSKNESLVTNIPQFNGMKVSSTSFGWLLLIDEIRGQNPLYSCLINPTSQHKIQLPPFKPKTNSSAASYKCLLSKPPTEPDCHVLLIIFSGAADQLLFCRIGDENFIKNTDITRGGAFGDAAGLNGKLYAWMRSTRQSSDSLVQIDFNFEGQDQMSLNKLVEISRPIPENTPWLCNYLVEFSRDELLLVYLIGHPHSPQLRCFRIFKLNPSEKDLQYCHCQELKSIGDHTIFLGHSGSICTKNKSGFKKNSIYYIDPPSRSICVYDINDKSKMFIKPGPINRCNLKSWIMMTM